MGKSIIITESQYERIFLNEQSPTNGCSKVGTRLFSIKPLIKGQLPKSIVKVATGLGDGEGCNLVYTIDNSNMKLDLYILEKPNNFVITVTSKNGSFNYGLDLENLTYMKIFGVYNFSKLQIVSPRIYKIEDYKQNGQMFNDKEEFVYNNASSFKEVIGNIKFAGEDATNQIDDDTKNQIDTLEDWIDIPSSKEDLFNISTFFMEFEGKCGELDTFQQQYKIQTGDGLAKRISWISFIGPWFGNEDYGIYKDDLNKLLSGCSDSMFGKIKQNIKQMKK